MALSLTTMFQRRKETRNLRSHRIARRRAQSLKCGRGWETLHGRMRPLSCSALTGDSLDLMNTRSAPPDPFRCSTTH